MQRSPDWYKDAIVYEVPVRSFRDGNGDGIGDLAGLISKLDYLVEIGITAIWLLPLNPSPLRDDGYDVEDYYGIHPMFGDLDDFRRLITEAHGRGLQVITELVVNHTSDQHPWFQRARAAKPGSPERDFYVWSETPQRYAEARVIFNDMEESNWTWDDQAGAYYWHRFFSHQPDLNYDHPEVRAEVFRILEFWLDMGVDGLRLDAVPYLFEREGTNCENLPETHAFLKDLRRHLDVHYPGTMMLAEANQWPEDTLPYFGDGDESHMNYHFPLMPRLFLSLARGERSAITEILHRTPPLPEPAQWGIFLRNHDELTLEMVTPEERRFMWDYYASDPRAPLNMGIRRRLAPLLGNDPAKLRLMFSLLLSLPGTPFLYYGDEIGMGDNLDLPDRDGVRTPMQWDASANGGFSEAPANGLAVSPIDDGDYGFERVNVTAQMAEPDSLLNWIRAAIALRKKHPAFGRGSAEWHEHADPAVLAFTISVQVERIFVAANFSAGSVSVDVPAGIDLWAGTPVAGRLDLDPHGFVWLQLA